MSGEWLERDAIGTRAVASVEVGPRSIVLRAGSAASEVPFGEVLGIVRDRDAAVLLAPRRRPSPPWFVIPATSLGDSLDAFVDSIDRRTREGHYREAPARRSLRSKEDLRTAVLSRRPIPGEVDVPVGLGPGGKRRLQLGLGASSATIAFGGALFAAAPLVGAPIATLGAAAAMVSLGRFVRDRRRRVLVLAPDGLVVGLPEGVLALEWHELAPIGIDEMEPGRGLAFRDRDLLAIGFLHESWIAAPLERVAAIAEHYRTRYAR
jgi:hypothetical protein